MDDTTHDPSDRPLEGWLKSLETEGEAAGSGAFGLDPRRALAMLASQGRLGIGGPLFLLSALYQHTGGAPLEHRKGLLGDSLVWRGEPREPLPESVPRILASEAFLSRAVALDFLPNEVQLRSSERFRPGVGDRVAEMFDAVRDRLALYPWQDSVISQRHWRDEETFLRCSGPEGGRLFLQHPTSRGSGSVRYRVNGIVYRDSWPLPVDGIIIDDRLRPDLSLSAIPESERKAGWLDFAEKTFLDALHHALDEADALELSVEPEQTDNLVLLHLPYLLRQQSRPDLTRAARSKVCLPDIFGRGWSLGELEDSYQQHGRLLVVPTVPSELPQRLPRRPVLWWEGQARQIGGRVFPQVSSGAGYLYSLKVNEQEKHRVSMEIEEEALATVAVDDGQLSLLPWAEEDRTAEVILVGARRSAETSYLEDDAPRNLRLLWDCEREVGEQAVQQAFSGRMKIRVLDLLDRSLAEHTLEPDRLVASLLWALEPGEPLASQWEHLKSSDLLPDVRGEYLSFNRLRDLEATFEGLPVLKDLSTSLPTVLPADTIVWWHPLLEHLRFSCREMGRKVREAHWKEEGRARWLERHEPAKPTLAQPHVEVEGHLVARREGHNSELLVWREGRPLGRRPLSAAQCPPGYSIVWVDDSFAADKYWSGPEPSALNELGPRLQRLCAAAEELLD